jgi:hypothetical protein
VTDEEGVARVDLTAAEVPGDHSVSVSFAGRDGELGPAIATSPFSIRRDDSTTTLISSGGKSPLSARLADQDSAAPLAGRTVAFVANGERIGTAVTNDDGVATMDTPKKYRGKGVAFEAAVHPTRTEDRPRP